MAPKRWGRPAGPQATSTTSSTDAVLEFICSEIADNNCLGLPADEVTGMAKELLHAKTRAEVLDWSRTLMMTETFAEEIIKRRESNGPAFDGETLPTATAAPEVSWRSGVAGRKVAAKRGKRGININQLPKKSAATEALKPGLFECGCFATIHQLRSNCANCGRIICEQEADEFCYFCGLDPSRCIAYEISVQEGKLSEAAQERNREDYEAAVARRDQLLDYAANKAKRTTVIDDQSATLFAPQSAWMSPEERRVAAKSAVEEERQRNVALMHHQRGAYRVHLDFVNQNLSLGARAENAGDDAAKTGTSGAAASPSEVLAEEEEEVWDEDLEIVPTGVEPLPSLLQKIWYRPDGEVPDEKQPPHGSSKDSGVKSFTVDVDLPQPDGASAPLRAPPTRRWYDDVSRRVQQQYFEEDVAVFAEEVKESRNAQLMFSPAVLVEGDDIDECGGAPEKDSGETEGAGDTNNALVVQAPGSSLLSRFAPTPLMLTTDAGVCLSMHQPWASLLIAGIKTHEGRVWGTEYRGRLWIHAAAAQAVNVKEVEEHYAAFMSPGQVFPANYPTKVLLGYVYLTECMDRKAYEASFPPAQRQEESPFSFICVQPKALPFFLPMSGNHKLFTLEHRVLVAAKKQLGEVT